MSTNPAPDQPPLTPRRAVEAALRCLHRLLQPAIGLGAATPPQVQLEAAKYLLDHGTRIEQMLRDLEHAGAGSGRAEAVE